MGSKVLNVLIEYYIAGILGLTHRRNAALRIVPLIRYDIYGSRRPKQPPPHGVAQPQ